MQCLQLGPLLNKHRINNYHMQPQALHLSDQFISLLVKLPETGMGYQLVKVVLKSGKILRRQKVLNSEILMVDQSEPISSADIEKIEPDYD